MVRSLAKVLTKASHLPEAAQEQLAAQLLEEIEGELKWDQTLAESQDLLENMAQKARRARQRGKTTRKGFDEL